MDGTDLADWPTILGAGKAGSDGGAGGTQEQSFPGNNNNSSASWGERNVQLKEGAAGGGPGNTDNPPTTRSSPLLSSSSLNECVQSSGGAWGSSSSKLEAGLGSAAFYNSKVSHPHSEPQESASDGDGDIPSATFNPSMNPTAWPALVQGSTSSWASDGLSSHSSTTSASSFSASTSVVTTHPLSPVNPTGLLQQHTDSATGGRSGEQQQHLGSQRLELGPSGERQVAGPKQVGGNERGSGIASAEGEGDGSLPSVSISSSVASSWRSMPPVSSDLSAGASQVDGWGGGGTVAQGQEGSAWGSSSHSGSGGVDWGKENDGSNTPVVSQGAWEGSGSETDWGGTAGGASSSSSETGGAGDGSTVVGGGVSVESTSPKMAAITKAWDNQKGTDSGDGSVGDWGGGQSVGGGGGGLSSSSGGGSIAGSGEGESDGSHKHEDASSGRDKTSKTSNAEVALLGMLNRSDLDPRVLSNTGWGQTQIRQNVAWDLESARGAGGRNERGLSSANTASPGYHPNAGTMSNDPPALPPSHNSSLATVRDGWAGGTSQPTGGTSEKETESSKGKAVGGWGEPPPPSKGWGGDEPQWGDQRSRGGNWGDVGEQGSGWADTREDKAGRAGGWKATGTGETGSWRGQSDGGGGADWGQRDALTSGGGGNGRNPGGGSSDKSSSWGNVDEGGPHRGGWGGGDVRGAKPHQDWGGTKPHTAAAAAQIPNSQVAPMKAPNQQQQHQSQGQQAQGGPAAGGWNNRPGFGGGASPSKNQNQSSGWTSGPIPQISGSGGGSGNDSLEPSGWEEPSPQSISRKMEIDDGTSAWGDPSRYNSKNVNLWDKNSAPASQGHGQQALPPMQQQQPPPPRRQQNMQHNRDANPSNAVVGNHRVGQ